MTIQERLLDIENNSELTSDEKMDLKNFFNRSDEIKNNGIDYMDDCLEYGLFDKEETNLPMNVFITDIGGDVELAHIIVQDNNEDEYDYENVIHVSIGSDPIIVEEKYNLKGSDVEKVFDFIKKYKEELILYWSSRIDYTDFLNIIDENSDITLKDVEIYEIR